MKQITVSRQATKRDQVINALKSGPKKRIYLLGLTGGLNQALATLLRKMVNKGQIVRTGFGIYELNDKK